MFASAALPRQQIPPGPVGAVTQAWAGGPTRVDPAFADRGAAAVQLAAPAEMIAPDTAMAPAQFSGAYGSLMMPPWTGGTEAQISHGNEGMCSPRWDDGGQDLKVGAEPVDAFGAMFDTI